MGDLFLYAFFYLPAEKLIAAPQPNALKPIKIGKTLEAKF